MRKKVRWGSRHLTHPRRRLESCPNWPLQHTVISGGQQGHWYIYCTTPLRNIFAAIPDLLESQSHLQSEEEHPQDNLESELQPLYHSAVSSSHCLRRQARESEWKGLGAMSTSSLCLYSSADSGDQWRPYLDLWSRICSHCSAKGGSPRMQWTWLSSCMLTRGWMLDVLCENKH